MPIDNDKIIASAKKAARRLARASEASYQTCLDTIARNAGRPHWGAFLADPVRHDLDHSIVIADDGDHDSGDAFPDIADPVARRDLTTTVDIVSDAIRSAVRMGRDAVGHERGRLRSWSVGGSSDGIGIPAHLVRHLPRAILSFADARIGERGTFGFRFDDREMALVVGRDDSLVVSLKGLKPAEWFGRFRPGDRIEADGTVVKGPEHEPRRVSPFSRALQRRVGIARSIVTRMGGGIGNEALREAVARRILSIRKDGYGYSLGRLADGPAVFTEETLSVHVSAPPGTGKTAGAVMPAILTADHSSLIIHDERNQWEMTSGYRETLGPVHVINFGGPSNSSLNPLHVDWVPRDGTERAIYVSRLAEAIHPEDDHASAYMAEAILRTLETSGPTCFGDVAALLEGRVGKGGHDGMQAGRTILALAPFLSEQVAACTTDSGLRPDDLRGVPSLFDQGWNPITVYLVRGRHGSGSGKVAALVQTAIWHHAIGDAPGSTRPDGSRVGPLAVNMILDGCEALAPMPMLGCALERGRATKVGHIVVSNTRGGLPRLFAGRLEHDCMSLFAVQIVFCQNDVHEAERIAKRFGDLAASELCSMPRGRHLLIVQGSGDPMWMRTPLFFENPVLLQRTYNPRTRLGPSPVILGRG